MTVLNPSLPWGRIGAEMGQNTAILYQIQTFSILYRVDKMLIYQGLSPIICYNHERLLTLTGWRSLD